MWILFTAKLCHTKHSIDVSILHRLYLIRYPGFSTIKNTMNYTYKITVVYFNSASFEVQYRKYNNISSGTTRT